MSIVTRILCAGALLAGTAGSAQAVVVRWADWQARQGQTVTGQIVSGDQTIGITFDGGAAGAVYGLVNGGTSDYYREYPGFPKPYTGGEVENAPPGNELIQLSNAGTRTITFSEAVVDPYLAFISWNGQRTTFSGEIDLISEGRGYWGSGALVLDGAGTGFSTIGEWHGILRLKGTYTSFTFTDAFNELWHGLTIGIGSLPTSEPVETPEPAAIALLGLGLAGVAGLRRRRKA